MSIASEAPPAEAVEWRVALRPVPYHEAVAEMEARARAIRAGEAPELVWLLEHPALYTAGTSAKETDLVDPILPVHHTGRGGQWTYHGPGQRVAYVMLDLKKRGGDLHVFVRNLEDWLIRTIGAFGIKGERRPGRVGIWVADGVKENKIGAIGVRVRQGVTYHGISVNLSPDLAHYRGIVPCGISDHGVTSLKALGVKAKMKDLDTALKDGFAAVFG